MPAFALMPAPVDTSPPAFTPAPACKFTPAEMPAPAFKPAPTPAPASSPTPVLIPIPALIPAPALTPAPACRPAFAETPTLRPAPPLTLRPTPAFSPGLIATLPSMLKPAFALRPSFRPAFFLFFFLGCLPVVMPGYGASIEGLAACSGWLAEEIAASFGEVRIAAGRLGSVVSDSGNSLSLGARIGLSGARGASVCASVGAGVRAEGLFANAGASAVVMVGLGELELSLCALVSDELVGVAKVEGSVGASLGVMVRVSLGTAIETTWARSPCTTFALGSDSAAGGKVSTTAS